MLEGCGCGLCGLIRICLLTVRFSFEKISISAVERSCVDATQSLNAKREEFTHRDQVFGVCVGVTKGQLEPLFID